jgi:hypothetical protein
LKFQISNLILFLCALAALHEIYSAIRNSQLAIIS